MTRIKICGLTQPEQALACVEAGADAIGLVFYPPSPRHLELEAAAEITRALPPFCTTVALFLNPEASEVQRVLQAVDIDLLQFHGAENAAFCEQFSTPYIKSVPMGESDFDPVAFEATHPKARGFLYDSNAFGAAGGSGHTFDWSLWPSQASGYRILAGGLTPDNVIDALQATRPYALDVSSGVESSPGIKAMQRVHSFIDQVRSFQ